jgi:hypothetical protein
MSQNPLVTLIGVVVLIGLGYLIFTYIGRSAGIRDEAGYEGSSFWGGVLIVMALLTVISILLSIF